MKLKAFEKIIVALDVETEKEALKLVKALRNEVGAFKVGKELFTSLGPSIVKKIQKLGGKVFLDLKFHDIPHTVYKAVKQACKLQVSMLTIHISGGLEMMKLAIQAKNDYKKESKRKGPLILGVTVLTSLNDASLAELGFKKKSKEQVLHFAKLAYKQGLDGLISSPKEVPTLKKIFKKKMLLVTPGIRPKFNLLEDQKRVMTPQEATRAKVDFMVIGRPITQSRDPKTAARKIAEEIKLGL